MKKRPRDYANVYLVQLAYGGPEEGGWWYDTGEFLYGLPIRNKRHGDRLLKRLRDRFHHLDDAPKSNVNSNGEIQIYIERGRGKHFPTRRPIYE